MRYIGMDIHRDFCEIAICENQKTRLAGQVKTDHQALTLFAQSLVPTGQVAVETSGNSLEIVRILEPHVGSVLIAETRQLKAITHAKVKNDRVDATMLARLLASGMLPGVWACDEQTRVLRRWVSRRTQLVGQRTRTTNQIHAVLIRRLKNGCPIRNLMGKKGRAWLESVELPEDESHTVSSCLREWDFLTGEITAIDQRIAQHSLKNKQVRRLMTIPGVDVTTAATLIAQIGDIKRFETPRKLVGYLGLDPRVHQSGSSPERYGHISKQGASCARHVLCEAAQATMKSPGPLRAFGERVKGRRGRNVAIIAVARKIVVLSWHMLTKQQDYIYERPALTFRKMRKLELAAGAPKRLNPRGHQGPRTVDNPLQWKRECATALEHEKRYEEQTKNWKQKPKVTTMTT